MSEIQHLAAFNDASLWTILGDETANLVNVTADHLTQFGAIGFDKVNAVQTTTYAGVYRSDLSHNFCGAGFTRWCSEDRLVVDFFVGGLTDVTQLEVRLGSSATNCRVWVFDKTALAFVASSWNSVGVKWGKSTVTGTGMDPSAVTYMAVAMKFSAEEKALAGMKIDSVYLLKNTATVA